MKKNIIIILSLITIIILLLFLLLINVKKNEKIVVSAFLGDGSLIQSVELKKEKSIGNLVPVEIDGYKFLYWTINGEQKDNNYIIKNKDSIKAIYEKIIIEPEKFIVSFDTDGGSLIESINVISGNTINQPFDPTKDGYTFVEWQYNNQPFSFDTIINSDITLKAIWIEKEAITIQYTVTFDTDGGSKINSQTVNSGSKVSKPSNPTKNGYTFVEWQYNNKTFSFDTIIDKNITLKAKWKQNETTQIQYTVTFDTDGGSKINSQTVNSGSKVTRPSNPTKEGYTFVEWQYNNQAFSFDTIIDKNITLKAIWKKNEVLKTYKFSYRPNEDMFANGPQVVTVYDENNSVVNVKSISIDGYVISETNSKIIINYYDIEGVTSIDIYLKDGSGPFRATKK